MLERAFELNEELYQIAKKKEELCGEESETYRYAIREWSASNRLFAQLFGFVNESAFINAQIEYINGIQ